MPRPIFSDRCPDRTVRRRLDRTVDMSRSCNNPDCPPPKLSFLLRKSPMGLYTTTTTTMTTTIIIIINQFAIDNNI
eukprot:3105515-Amphidinium_carterae.1